MAFFLQKEEARPLNGAVQGAASHLPNLFGRLIPERLHEALRGKLRQLEKGGCLLHVFEIMRVAVLEENHFGKGGMLLFQGAYIAARRNFHRGKPLLRRDFTQSRSMCAGKQVPPKLPTKWDSP